MPHAQAPSELIPLRFMSPGQTARVGDLVGNPADVHRLEELGLRRGVTVEMLQTGSPCIIRFSGGKFCVRDADGMGVLVELGATQ